VPRSEALAVHVALENKDLMVGRVYAACGDDLALVVFDEAIMAEDLDVERPSSAQELVTRFETSLQYTAQWSRTVLERFGGEPVTADDWSLLSF
jgi:hypothetical protein